MFEGHVVNIFDATVVGILLLSCLFAFFRGFVREILSLGAWIGAAIVTIYYFPVVAEFLRPHFKSAIGAAGVGTLGIYTLALIGFSLINTMIIKLFKSGSDIGILDNLLGLIFGAFRGAFIISLIFFLITIALPEKEYPIWIKEALTKPYVEKGAVVLARAAPTYLREISSLEKKALEGQQVTEGGELRAPVENKDRIRMPDVTSESNETPEKETGYNRESKSQLDRLIDSLNRDQE